MMKTKPSKIRGFFIFGGFVFLLTLFLNGWRTTSRTGHFFVPMDELSRGLPFSIIAGVVVGLIYAFSLKE
jgi:ABC-type antimicrobial peptide transport system permease subunit